MIYYLIDLGLFTHSRSNPKLSLLPSLLHQIQYQHLPKLVTQKTMLRVTKPISGTPLDAVTAAPEIYTALKPKDYNFILPFSAANLPAIPL